MFNPLDDYYGLSPLEAAAVAVDTHNAAAKWNKALLDNAARPSGALVYAGPEGAVMSDAQFERLKKELSDQYQGTANAGRPLLLEGGLDWKAMSLSPKDMDFMEAKHSAAREIALAFGVPPMLLANSCRAFLPTPIPERTVRDILERAARAPSGGNVQPWRVDALAGAKLEELKALVRARPELLPRGEGAEYDIYPRGLKEPYETRRRQVGAALYQSIGVTRDDRAGRYRQYARNFEFFGAPVGLLLSIDRSMGPPQWSDLGGYIQTVMLLARGYGLHTCGQEAWTHWHKTVYSFLNIPPEYILFCGLALGYADETAPINRWRAPRAPLESYATFTGFDS